MLQPALAGLTSDQIRRAGGTQNNCGIAEVLARLEDGVHFRVAEQTSIDRTVFGMNRERSGRAANEPVQAVSARHVLHVVSQVMEECGEETASFLVTFFT